MANKYNIENAKKILIALAQAGANPTILPLLMSQVAHETGDFDSTQFKINNNASGITYTTSGRQKNATKGNPLPINEQPLVNGKRVIKYYYAKFPTLKDWAVDYMRIVGTNVLKATDVVDYAKRLKAQNYYKATVQTYTNGLKFHLNELTKLGLTKYDKIATVVDEKKKLGNGIVRDFFAIFNVFK